VSTVTSVEAKCCLAHAQHPLHADERATLEALLASAESIRLLPTHCVNTENQLEGFHMTLGALEPGSSLPVHRSMFFGHSLFECVAADQLINGDVVRLLGRDNVADVRAVLGALEAEAVGREASFDHAPDNADAVGASQGQVAAVSYARGKRAVDSKRWRPEPPAAVGLYHAMVRGYQKDVRQHKLFIGVSGGCPKCSDAFYNLMLDVGAEWTCKEVADSEEVWWLRKASQRARCMVASAVARRFGLTILEHHDVHSYDQEAIGVPTVDTVEHDVVLRGGKVHLYNACCDTTSLHNGVLCQMNPAEGYWLFRGSPRSSSRSTSFGSMFGHASGIFPTHSPLYTPKLGSPSWVQGLDTKVVVRRGGAPRQKGDPAVYQCFDEAFMRNLEAMGWNRDHGVVELVPIVVGVV
jgi:hypothetical protein